VWAEGKVTRWVERERVFVYMNVKLYMSHTDIHMWILIR